MFKTSFYGKNKTVLKIIANKTGGRFMYKNTMNIIKSAGTGLAAGMLVGYVSSQMIKPKPPLIKRKASKAVHAVGDVLGSASYFLKHV